MSAIASALLLTWIILRALRSPWSTPVGALLLAAIFVAVAAGAY